MEELFSVQRARPVRTGQRELVVYECHAGETDFLFLPRHGRRHEVPPHEIDHAANIRALLSLGATGVIATGAVGSISKKLEVGRMGLVEQFIDISGRGITAFEGKVVHTDMTNPYDPELRRRLAAAARSLGIPLSTGLCYISVAGPRYETAAEIRAFSMLGADVVGMTGAPEAIVANELGLKYSSLVVSTNWAAGMQERVSHEEVLSMMGKLLPQVKRLIERVVSEP